MSLLLSSGKIANLEINNRIVMPPMCLYKTDNSGIVSDFHKYHYVARAIGGVGLIIVEATGVETRGRITNKDLGLWSDEQIAGHKVLVDECHKFGAKMAIQLAHAGRKSEATDSTPLAPSALSFSEKAPYKIPQEASMQDIIDIKKAFVAAAMRAKKAGYDSIQIHGAHGYLISEFLSPLINKRTDKYGGSIENRMRLLLEITQEIKEKVDLPLSVRISADEWMPDGWNIEDSILLSKELENAGADAIDVSAGGFHLAPTQMPKIVPFYQCEYAKAIKNAINIPVIAVGKISNASEGEALLMGEICDFVAYGKELLRSPNLAFYIAQEFGENNKIEQSYQRAF